MTPLTIDWTDPKNPIGKHFTVHDATFLPSFHCYHTPSEAEQLAIYEMAIKMDDIRDMYNKPIAVNCWIRPKSINCPGSEHDGKDYNDFVHGAKASAHILGSAVDFVVVGEDPNESRKLLAANLDKLQVRAEDHFGPWLHADIKWLKGGNNFFKV